MSGDIKDHPERNSPPHKFGTSLKLQAILKELPALIGYLLKGLFIFLGSKTKNDGIPNLYRSTKQIIPAVIESIEAEKPKVTEARQLSKGSLIITGQYLKTRGVAIVIWIVELIIDLSTLLYDKVKKTIGNKVNIIRQDITTEQTKDPATPSMPPPPEIILKEEETISLNERLAQQILQNGIECKAVINIGSFKIERKPYYSYLFAMTPRIITNRGCIRFDRNGTRNIDFMQIIQKN